MYKSVSTDGLETSVASDDVLKRLTLATIVDGKPAKNTHAYAESDLTVLINGLRKTIPANTDLYIEDKEDYVSSFVIVTPDVRFFVEFEF